jgi:alpha-ribazole phosphatase
MDEETTRLYLARHGQVVNDGVYNGHTNVDISAAGEQQMERLRGKLQDKKLAAIYSSDLLRTQRGAQIVASVHNLKPQSCPEFREMNFGRWQGLRYPEVMERFPDDIPGWVADLENFRVPGGESFADARKRAIPKLQELIVLHRGRELAMICHGALNRVILAEAMHLPMAHLLRIEQDYGCLNIIEYTPTWTVVKLLNG